MPDCRGAVMTSDEVRAVQLGLLDAVDGVCHDHGLRYFFWAGTLLGAIRHGGVIPWDDDIDLSMPRADYERFCAAFAVTKPDRLELYTQELRSDYEYPFARVADTRTWIFEGARISTPMGAFIDIFPMDGWPRGRVLQRLHGLHLRFLHGLVTVWGARPKQGRELHKRVVIALLKPVQRMPVGVLTRWISRVARLIHYDTAESVGVTVFRYVERVDRAAYGEPVEIEFEGRRYRACPQAPDRILRNLYGDYMTLPPESERGERHIHGARWAADVGVGDDGPLPVREEMSDPAARGDA